MEEKQIVKQLEEAIRAATYQPSGSTGEILIAETPVKSSSPATTVSVILAGKNSNFQVPLKKLTAEIEKRGGTIDVFELYSPPVPKILLSGKFDDSAYNLVIDLAFPESLSASTGTPDVEVESSG